MLEHAKNELSQQLSPVLFPLFPGTVSAAGLMGMEGIDCLPSQTTAVVLC